MTAWCRPLCDPGRLTHNGHPSVPAVADGARDWAPAPMVVTPGADGQRQLLVQVHPWQLLPGAPSPDSLVSVEVRAIAGQVHQAQAQPGRGQAGPQGVAPTGCRIVQNYGQHGSECRARSCHRKAAEVAGLLWPDSSVTSTAPVPTLTGPYYEHPVPALRPPPLDPRPR